MTKTPWTAWLLPLVNILAAIIVALYLVTYVTSERIRNDCREAFDAAVYASLSAGRAANLIEATAFDATLNGLLGPNPDPTALIAELRDRRGEAARLRVDNPLPDPYCQQADER